MQSLSQEERDYLAGLLAEQAAPAPKPKHGLLWHLANATAWIFIVGLFVMMAAAVGPDLLVSYGLVAPETMERFFRPAPTVAPVQPPAAQQRPAAPPLAQPQAPPAPQPIGAPLPACSQVADTTTACAGAAVPAPTWCEDVPAGAGIAACQWRDAEAARQLQQQTEREALALWGAMADEAIEQDLRAPATTPTAEVPTECVAPPNARARAACELIRRGIIHPKG